MLKNSNIFYLLTCEQLAKKLTTKLIYISINIIFAYIYPKTKLLQMSSTIIWINRLMINEKDKFD